MPAVVILFGRATWRLSRWLTRGLPNIDVEGEQLRHRLADAPAGTPDGLPERRLA